MAKRRPLEALSPAYRRRLERAIERGKATPEGPRAAARGHASAKHAGHSESQRRRARERALKAAVAAGEVKLTPQQIELGKALETRDRAFARKFAREQLAPHKPDEFASRGPAELERMAVAAMAKMGVDQFRKEVAYQKALNRQYEAERKAGTYIGITTLAALVARAKATGFGDGTWYFYH